MRTDRHPLELDTLVALFFDQPERLGHFTEVAPADVPPGYHELLAHEHHMTVTVEQFHNCRVDVRVLDKRITPTHYARLIVLERQRDRAVVQFGIMRVNFAYLSEEVRREIESERTPLGRILIEHDVLRQVHLYSLYEVVPGPDLCRFLGIDQPLPTFGRTAVIDCNHEPAIELLEIVTPLAGLLQ
jgi:chorismate-pyruvate lyase